VFEEALDALHRMIDNLDHDRLIRKNRLFMDTYVDNDAAVFSRGAPLHPSSGRSSARPTDMIRISKALRSWVPR
jgi:hypothetical protein